MTLPHNGTKVTIRPTATNIMDANGRKMPDAPREVVWSPWWSSRLRDGDVVIVPPAAPVLPVNDNPNDDEA